MLWLLASRGDRPEFRRSSRLFVAGTAACAILLVSTAFLPAGARVPAWALIDAAYLAGFAAAFLTATPEVAAALTISDALIERFGLLIIIVLGEIMTSVVAGLASQPPGALTLSVGLVAVVVGFGAWWTYFDFAGQRSPRPATTASLQWMLSHLPLTAAVAAIGAAMVSLVDHAHDSRGPGGRRVSTVRGHRRRAVRHDAGIGQFAGLGRRTGPVPAARPYLRRRGGSVPRARRPAANAARPRPRARPAAQHPVGIRRGAPRG
jgi:hypothetical protein